MTQYKNFDPEGLLTVLWKGYYTMILPFGKMQPHQVLGTDPVRTLTWTIVILGFHCSPRYLRHYIHPQTQSLCHPKVD